MFGFAMQGSEFRSPIEESQSPPSCLDIADHLKHGKAVLGSALAASQMPTFRRGYSSLCFSSSTCRLSCEPEERHVQLARAKHDLECAS